MGPQPCDVYGAQPGSMGFFVHKKLDIGLYWPSIELEIREKKIGDLGAIW